MKAKSLFLVIACLLLFITSVMAQTNYYSVSDTFPQNGYTYLCEVDASGLVLLYNQANVYVSDHELYKNGDSLSLVTKKARYDWELPVISGGNYFESRNRILAIAADVLSPNQLSSPSSLDVSVTINTTTGKVMEVEFWFVKQYAFATVPVSQYREIEQRIKADSAIWFTLSDFGKQLNRIKLEFDYEP
jgi:quinolinate synthase